MCFLPLSILYKILVSFTSEVKSFVLLCFVLFLTIDLKWTEWNQPQSHLSLILHSLLLLVFHLVISNKYDKHPEMYFPKQRPEPGHQSPSNSTASSTPIPKLNWPEVNIILNPVFMNHLIPFKVVLLHLCALLTKHMFLVSLFLALIHLCYFMSL